MERLKNGVPRGLKGGNRAPMPGRNGSTAAKNNRSRVRCRSAGKAIIAGFGDGGTRSVVMAGSDAVGAMRRRATRQALARCRGPR